MRCEDFPCCGHELGCCPDFDRNGKQLNMVCVCGAKIPVDSPTSLCSFCLNHNEDGRYIGEDEDEPDYDDEDDDFDEDEEDYFYEDDNDGYGDGESPFRED